MRFSKGRVWKHATMAVLGAVGGFVIALLILRSVPGLRGRATIPPSPSSASTTAPPAFKPSKAPVIDPADIAILQKTDDATARVAKAVVPAVVNIFTSRTVAVRSPLMLDPLFGRLIRVRPQLEKSQSLGSGVFVTGDGYITSSYHLVAGAEEIHVLLHDGRMAQAVVVGSDPRIDIVVLKIEGSDFMTLPLGDSDELEVGDFVLAVGNPYGFGHTVTQGIVSAVNRSGVGLHPYEDFIQTDAAVNMGNSGGALINSRAELVGINSAIISKTGGFQGISLATPINLVKEALPYLIRGERVSRGWLGVHVMVLTPGGALARQLGYKGDLGLVVTGIEPGSPALSGGIEPADVLVRIDGKAMKAPRDFKRSVTSKRAGDVIEVAVWRRGREIPLRITLGEMPYREEPTAPGP